MTRIDAKNSSISIKTPKKHNNFHCGLLFLNIVLIIFLIIAYFITKETKKPSSEDLSENFVVRSIPRLYTKLENIDPEERDVFQGFQTSFLPPEEIVLASKGHPEKRARKGEEEYEGNVTSDYSEEDDLLLRTRVKRMSLTSHNQDDEDNEQKEPIDDEYSEDIESDEDSDYDSTEYEENENLKRIMNPETQADKGPLDDVVEQIRGQPELEEAETGSAPNLYNPRKLVTGIHAFWKGQGNKETIRNTQAQIMLKYMDLDANPCEDFYQYACGNWASMNPIPADKAGYDTFEMLRENLDIVLKDLLEFKSHERVPSVHPSKNLINHIIFLKKIPKDMCAVNNIKGNSNLSTQISLDELIKNTSMPETDIETAAVYADEKIKNSTSWESKHSKSEIINRIRRYLDRKSELINHPISTLALKLRKYFGHKNSHKAASNNLIAKPFDDKEQRRVKNSLIRRNQFGRKLLAYKTNKVKKRKTRQITPVSSDDYDSLENAIEYSLNTGDAQLKARYLFKSCMNTSILDMRGHQPLLDLIDQLGGWPILNPNWNSTHFDYLEVMAQLRLYNNDILLSEWVGPDIKNSDEFVVQFDQTSLGLPSRDYFLQKSNRIYLAAYRSYLVTVALLLGGNPEHVKKSARKLIEFEVKLAKITSAPEDRRNVSELYQRMPLSKLEALVPEIDWRRYLCIVMNRTVGSEETVVLFALTYVRNLVKLIEQTDPAVLSDYLLWRFVRHRVNNLDDRFQSAKQQFYFILFGREEAPPRWKNCISQVNANMGMALGSMFVKNYFDEISKNDTLTMTREIQQSFRELLRITDWIDVKTKELAAHKVDAMMLRIGYPDFILNKEELDDRYKEVTVHPDMYFENILNILQHLTKMEQSRIGQPVNKTLWNTAPAVVNAYYSRNKNQIMFPAGILQPPFYHRHFPRSLNYGGIGVVIGHEITHGFDDKGRLFDCHGNLQRWWSDSAIEVFHNRAQCLIDQYGKYVVPEVNIPLNGVNTQGENIADNGGVKQAFRAYMNWLEGHSADDETLPGLNHTHKQLFFLNFAQVWCGAMRPEAMRNKLKTAVHSPGRFRVIGTLSNSEDFAREFHCAKGTPMNPVEKCNVWCGAMRPEAMRNKPKTAVHSPGRFRVIGTLSNSEDFAREFHCAKGTPMNPVEKCNVW